jgi:hypothetical protein
MTNKKEKRIASLAALASIGSVPFIVMTVLRDFGIEPLSALFIAAGLFALFGVLWGAYLLGYHDRQ